MLRLSSMAPLSSSCRLVSLCRLVPRGLPPLWLVVVVVVVVDRGVRRALVVEPLVVVGVGHRLELGPELRLVVEDFLHAAQQLRVHELVQPEGLALLCRVVLGPRDPASDDRNERTIVRCEIDSKASAAHTADIAHGGTGSLPLGRSCC